MNQWVLGNAGLKYFRRKNYVFVTDQINSYCKLKESIREKIRTQLSNFERKNLVEYRLKNLSSNNSIYKLKNFMAISL